MDDETALLRASFEHPDEDGPRLAFADYLSERGAPGDDAWAELIRVQVALALGPGADRDHLTARERELVPAVSAAWPGRFGLPNGLAWPNWTRGFPVTLAGPGELIRAAYPAFAGRVAVREFNVRDATDADLLALAAWPESRHVRKLGVWTDRGPVGEAAFVALVSCPALGGVERLRVDSARLTEVAAVAFLDSALCANLVHLKLRAFGGLGGLSEETRQRLRGRFGHYDVY